MTSSIFAGLSGPNWVLRCIRFDFDICVSVSKQAQCFKTSKTRCFWTSSSINLPGWRWAGIKQLALVGSSSSLHSEACKALGGSDGVIHSRISDSGGCVRANTNCKAPCLIQVRTRLLSAPATLQNDHPYCCVFIWHSHVAPVRRITAFTSLRTNLSPFTKGCRERDASM